MENTVKFAKFKKSNNQTIGTILTMSFFRHKFLVEKPKSELFESFRARLCSGFSMFSDQEIEEGILEVNITR